MSSPSPLLVLAVAGKQSRSRTALRAAVEANGGVWLPRQKTVRGVVAQIRESAPGTHVLFLGPSDMPLPECLRSLTQAWESYPLSDVLYADKQKVGQRSSSDVARLRFPLWSPHRLEFEQFVGETFVARVPAILSIASGFELDDPWDNWRFLSASARLDARVTHIDDVWFEYGGETESYRGDKPNEHHAEERRLVASTSPPLPGDCSLITLTAGAALGDGDESPLIVAHLAAVSSSTASASEHIVVIGAECAPNARTLLSGETTISLVEEHTPFNFARRANLGRESASQGILVFVNDDFVPLRADWLDLLIAPFRDAGVAITGGTLLYPDETIQHLGVGVIDGSDCHFYRGSSLTEARVSELVSMNREVDAVTGACLAIRASVFDEVGGFFEAFPLNYNDIDLCLKARTLGHSIVHVGEPLGHHYESLTRKAIILPEEATLFYSRWPARPAQSEFPFELFG